MKKLMKLLLLFFAFICFFQLPSEAKKCVMKITPAQVIKTADNAIKVDDSLDFKVVEDVMKGPDVFIAKDTPVKATVSYVQSEAWIGESTILELSHFETTDVDSNPVIIDYDLKIKGRYGLKTPWEFTKYFVKGFLFYANVHYLPDSVVFNVLFDER